MNVDHLASDEALSPELVLVLSPALRAQAVARLGPPVSAMSPRRATAFESPAAEPFARSLGQILVARVTQLAVMFVAVTILTLAMALAAHALR